MNSIEEQEQTSILSLGFGAVCAVMGLYGLAIILFIVGVGLSVLNLTGNVKQDVKQVGQKESK